MLYYDESGKQLNESEIDLKKGYLAVKEMKFYPKEEHREVYATTPEGVELTRPVVDKEAYTEVISQTYIKYADHPTRQDELEAALVELANMIADNAARLDEQEAALVDVAAVAAGEE